MYSSSHISSLGKSAYSGNMIPLTGPKVNGIKSHLTIVRQKELLGQGLKRLSVWGQTLQVCKS